MESLRKQGYKAGFVTKGKDIIQCIETKKEYAPTDLKIVKLQRFEGESDPGDSSIVYAVECSDGQKGTIIAAYGTYGSTGISQFMKKVKTSDRSNIAGPTQQPITA